MNKKAVAVLAAKLALSVALLFVVLAKVNVHAVLGNLGNANWVLVVIWYSLVPVSIVLIAWRWRILAPGLSYGTAMKYTWIGLFFGHVLPGSIAGDIAKGVSLALKDSGARAGLAASIVAEKVIGLVALVLFFDVACTLVYFLSGNASAQVTNLAALALMLSLGAIAGTVIAALLARRLGYLTPSTPGSVFGRIVSGVTSAARFYSNKPGLLGKAFAISVAIHILNIFAMWLAFIALRLDAGMLFAAVVYPVLSVILLIPISISGIGVRDATLALLFGLFGLSAASGVALSWLTLLAVIPNVAIGGAIQLMEMYRKH